MRGIGGGGGGVSVNEYRDRIQRKIMVCGTQVRAITSPYVPSRVAVDSNTITMGNPMPESTLTLYARVDFIPQRDFGFGLSCAYGAQINFGDLHTLD